MTLRLEDHWLWDFWLAKDGPDYHIFFLQAPRALGHESLRHWHATIGQAVSQDLCTWQRLPMDLRPSTETPQAWDSFTTWTGSVFHHAGLWYLFYTGGSRKEDGLVQRIGLATSLDLLHWKKHPNNPLITTNPTWYELLDLNLWHDQAWRDPWVFQDPLDGSFRAFITARVNYGPANGRGVIAQAHSEDLVHWKVLPPITEPGDYGHMEVPQLVNIAGRYYLLFSTTHQMYSKARLEAMQAPPLTGTFYRIANGSVGPFESAAEKELLADKTGSTYSGKLVQDPEGDWVYLCVHHFAPNGDFIGEISDPMKVHIHPDGSLKVVQADA